MKLIKIKGVVIKEVTYKDNDKIITLLTDELGKISCVARGSKKTNSPLLASCQIFVYSEFILYKGTGFYHVNSADTIDTFYSLRTNIEKLEMAYELTKIASSLNVEEQDVNKALSLYLNTLYIISKTEKNYEYISSVYKLKQLCLLGFSPNVFECTKCHKKIKDMESNVYYSFTTNNILCGQCINDKTGCIVLSRSTWCAVAYVILSDIKKIYSFDIKKKSLIEFVHFVKLLEIN